MKYASYKITKKVYTKICDISKYDPSIIYQNTNYLLAYGCIHEMSKNNRFYLELHFKNKVKGPQVCMYGTSSSSFYRNLKKACDEFVDALDYFEVDLKPFLKEEEGK